MKFIVAVTLTCILIFPSDAQQGTVETITYYSATQNDSCRMNVYCPPGYYDITDTNHYPVLYLMHGGGENYTYWMNNGEADETLNEYISTGKAVPMILVTPDGRNLSPEILSNEIRHEVIPYIESNFRVIADKDHRGIGGLSWGGMQALELGIMHYEMFGYMAILSSGYFSVDNFNRAEAFLDTTAGKVEKSIRYFYFAEGTKYDLAYESGMQALSMFREKGLTVHYWEYSGGHQWSVWIQDFKSFTPYLFRDTTTRYISLEFQGGLIKNSTVMTSRDSLATPPPDPTRTGYSFAGWYREPEYLDSFNFAMDTIKANMTLYAKWSINSYKVSFNSNGGDYTPDTVTAVYRAKIEEPAEPQKSGFIFGGWYTDDTFVQEWDFASSLVTGDITLYARWIDPTSLIENQESQIMVFPNPFTDELAVSFNFTTGEKLNISLIDIHGRTVKVMYDDYLKAGQNKLSWQLGDIPDGFYTLSIRSAENIFLRKLIKN
jgi:uncharacterized repeat protein (TIGR02543 family)